MREATPRKLSESLTRESKLTTATLAGGTWTDDETKALLEFLLLHRPEDKWPCTKLGMVYTQDSLASSATMS